MGISKERALQLIAVHLASGLSVGDFIDGGPTGSYGFSKDAVWSIAIPPTQLRVGACRFIVISKITGEILADQYFGE